MDISSQSAISHSLLTSETIEVLTKLGISSVRKFLEASAEDIIRACQLSKESIALIKNDLGSFLLIQKRHLLQIKSEPSMDDFLGGGLIVGHVYEICGPLSVGKTIFCQIIALKLAQKGIGCFYVDVNGDLVLRSMVDILMGMRRVQSEFKSILEIIRVHRVSNFSALKVLLQFILYNRASLKTYGLLIVDSIAPFHVMNLDIDRKDNLEKSKIARDCYKLMYEVAKDCNIAVIFTNLILSCEDDSKIPLGCFNIGLKLNETIPDLPFTRLRMQFHGKDSAKREVSVISSDNLEKNTKIIIDLTQC